ncbi:MAG: hypothetical protein U0270_29775 [Labilithrix sp.]
MRLCLALAVALAACAERPPAPTPAPTPAPVPTPAPTIASAAPSLAPPPPATPASCGPGSEVATTLPPWPARTIADAASMREPYVTSGTIVDAFVPAPCPPGATCKPQPPPYIAVGDGASPERSLVLFAPQPKSKPLGTRVRVAVEPCGRSGLGRPGMVGEGNLKAWAAER